MVDEKRSIGIGTLTNGRRSPVYWEVEITEQDQITEGANA
jgi:hypothetical protein